MRDWEAASARFVSSKAAAAGVFFLAILVPGAGHFYLRRRKKALLLASIIILTFVLGIQLEGKLFTFEKGLSGSETLINSIGSLAGLGNGILYFVAVGFDLAKGQIDQPTYEIGIAFLLSAGLFNILTAIDAYRCSIGYDYDAAEAARLQAQKEKKAKRRARKQSARQNKRHKAHK